MIEFYIICALVMYAVTFIITSSRSMRAFRNAFRLMADSRLDGTRFATSFVHRVNDNVVLENDQRDEEDVTKLGVGYDFISCRMCVGFWVSIPFYFFIGVLPGVACYGLSYFLATQERE